MTQHSTASNDSPERLWTYDAVRVGQAGNPTRVTLAPADIAEYAACAQNPDPRYARPPGPDAGDGNGSGSGSGAGGNMAAPRCRQCPLWLWPTLRCCARTLPPPTAS